MELADLSKDGIEALIEKLKGESEGIEYLDNKGSFAIPLKRIINHQKLVTRWFSIPNIFVLKKVYFRFDVACNDGTTVHYCVYSNNPRRPFNWMRIVSPYQWHKAMIKAKGGSSQSSSRLLRPIPGSLKKAIITVAAVIAIITVAAVISGPLVAILLVFLASQIISNLWCHL